MRWLPVFKNEMRLYFGSPMAYAVLFVVLFLCGLFFSILFLSFSDISMRSFMQPQFGQNLNATELVLTRLFVITAQILLFCVPMITMRLFAEEKRAGTLELLLTFPVRDGEILVGKFLAAVALLAILLGLSLTFPALVAYFTRVEWGTVLSGYLGLLLVGSTFLAIGILISSLTENQIIAGFIAFGLAIFFWVVGWFADITSGTLRVVLQYLSLIERMDGFSRGLIDTKDVVYYLSAIALLLFLTLRSLESKRWRG